jgi:acetyl-CoA carboxylase carboxyltransferase component
VGCTAYGASHVVASGRELRDRALRRSVARELGVLGGEGVYTCLHAEPEIRITAMAAFPEAVERAYMVGSS